MPCDVLVTGATGFVGRHVLARAREARLDARAIVGDLRRESVADTAIASARPAAVIHLASAARRTSPWDAMSADLWMARTILEAIARHAPEAVLLVVGSAAQYGTTDVNPVSEDAPTCALSGYGAVKNVVEHAVLADPLRQGIRVIFTRSFNHLGPGQGEDAPAGQWARQIVAAERLGGDTIHTGDLRPVRDFLDVRDVADAYLALIRSPAQGVVNVCSGVGIAVARVAEQLIALSRVPVRLERDAALVRSVDPPSVVGDPTRLHRLTGWTPRISLERSAADLLAACRAERDAEAQAVR